ncbi:MAG TPA: hypothetical protein DEG96_07445 [Candidatus Atribacteria bacterium]|uniref:Uncharacterized protein n=1 Tax=candidate division TA06 bacterium 34_109 TaxID=1635277 RepID=A0A101I0M6_UNCT6|nr:MAG: hypothetical protein XE03_1599 [candidate division TA06 bacterium 34_109]HBY57673.1 hypothetical protein [Candidatus Atribacteria bacterium]
MAKEALAKYFNIIREITGKSEGKIILNDEAGLADLFFRLADVYGQSFSKYIFNDQGELNSYIRLAKKGQLDQVSLNQKRRTNIIYSLLYQEDKLAGGVILDGKRASSF